MPTLFLFLMMTVAGYAVFVFVSEGFNPVRVHRSTALQKRQVVAVLSGLLIALSPLILYQWPAAALSKKVEHSLIAAVIGIVVLLTIIGVATLLSLLFRNDNKRKAVENSVQGNTVDSQDSHDSTNPAATMTSPLSKTETESTKSSTNQQQRVVAAIEEIAATDSDSASPNKNALSADQSIEIHTTENAEKMTYKNQKKEPFEMFNDHNQDLNAALDEAEAEMRQATANENLMTTQAAELREAKPILEPADSQKHSFSDQIAKSDSVVEKSTSETNRGTILQHRTKATSTLEGNVEKMSRECEATDKSLEKADRLMSQLHQHSRELDRIKQTRIEQQNSTILEQDKKIIEQRDQLTEESITSVAAQNLIGLQQDEINRVRSYGKKLESLILQHQNQLSSSRIELEKSREMAKKAAVLARQAADAHQKIKTIADQERQVRLQVEEKAHKAVKLAENAISALAKEEEKNANQTTSR